MKKYAKKVTFIIASQWNGGQDELAVQHLENFGYTVCFQAPRPGSVEVNDNNEEVPAQGLLVAVGKYNWEISYVEPGEFIRFSFHRGEDTIDIDFDKLDEVIDEVKAGTLEVTIASSKPRHLAKEYDI